MKQEKLIGASLILANIILMVFCLIRYIQSDKTAPKFLLESTDIIYTPGMDSKKLVQGITANDNRDGDVTDRIVIEKITEKRADHTAVVYYAVCDSSGNTAKLSKLFHADYPEEENNDIITEENKSNAAAQQDGEKEQIDSGNTKESKIGEDSSTIEEESAEETENEPEEEQESAGEAAQDAREDVEVKPEEDEEVQDRQEETRQEEGRQQAEQENPENQQAEGEQAAGSHAPELVLGSSEATIHTGTNPPWSEIITVLRDDEDDYATLYYNLHVSRYDRNKPGTYPVTVYVEDSDGNRSAEVPFTIIVREN